MSAINFLDIKKVEYKIPSLKKHKITEQHALNHHIITLYTMEIVDELSLLASEGIISDKDIKFFEKKSNLDVDYMEMLYSKHKKNTLFGSDFEMIKSFFNALAEKSLSDFQKLNQPFLLEILPIIYGLKFIKNNVQFVASVEKRIPDVNAVRIVREKIEELETLFLNLYAKCSNKKEFTFEQFKSLFDKVKKMTYREFEATVNSLTI